MSVGNVRVIYCSTVTSSLEKDNFIELVRASVINNKNLNITGILLFNGRYFFQVLEGDNSVVNKLLDKIGDDDRHDEIDILSRRAIDSRLFPKWSMELIDANNDFFKETYGGEFNPYLFTDQQSLECATNAKAWRMRRLQEAS